MNNQYTIISKLVIHHSYFEDGRAKNLFFKPAAQTQQIINTQNLILRIDDNQFSLISPKGDETIELLKYINETLGVEYFEFEISTKDPNFYNYTELPINWLGQIDFSNNSGDNKSGNNSLILTAKLTKKQSTSILGTVKFYLKELIAQAEERVSIFEIFFESRKTQWNYFVIAQKPLENLSIEGKSKIKFEGPSEVALKTGNTALRFSSGIDIIPMQEKPSLKFDLVQEQNLPNGGSISETILSGLPSAGPHKLELEETDGGPVASSAMYIYI